MQESKAYWGYTPEQLLAWRDELTLGPEHWERHVVYAASAGEELLGFYSLAFAEKRENSARVKMENLFVAPAAMGRGTGRQLFDHAVALARTRGSLELWLEADPHAAAFYQRMGMQQTGLVPGASPGRYLPLMILNPESMPFS